MADSPNLARPYCPGCDLLADVTTEILETRWCSAHAPATLGQLDHVQPSYQSYLSGNVDAEGESNRLFCNLIHRKGREA